MFDPPTRKRILDFVRPLEAGLDGVANFGQVQNRLARIERLRPAGRALDDDLLFLLGVFFGREKWLGKMGHASRTRIFLEGLGLSPERARAFFTSLSRAELAPVSDEEKIVWDADQLERLGAIGLLQAIVDAYKERLDLAETAEEIVSQQEEIALHTDVGRAIGADRVAFAREFARQLRQELDEQRIR